MAGLIEAVSAMDEFCRLGGVDPKDVREVDFDVESNLTDTLYHYPIGEKFYIGFGVLSSSTNEPKTAYFKMVIDLSYSISILKVEDVLLCVHEHQLEMSCPSRFELDKEILRLSFGSYLSEIQDTLIFKILKESVSESYQIMERLSRLGVMPAYKMKILRTN